MSVTGNQKLLNQFGELSAKPLAKGLPRNSLRRKDMRDLPAFGLRGGCHQKIDRPYSSAGLELRPILLPLLVLTVFWLQPIAAVAKATLAAVFSDNMVVQRDKPITVWGQASPGEKVLIKLATDSAQAVANSAGTWEAELKPLPLGGPYELTLTATNTLTVKNVMLGDVWLCGGQSNMWIKLKYSDYVERDLARANLPNLRYFRLEKNRYRQVSPAVNGAWIPFSKQRVLEIPAVQFHFGRQIHNQTHVPIGLIDLSYGGAPIECFLPDAPLAKAASIDGFFYTGAIRNGMVLPISRLRAKGALWYQGEANGYETGAYATLLAELISDWRKLFRDNQLPFYLVQLPNVGKLGASTDKSLHWTELREAQMKAANAAANAYITVNIDTVNGADAEIHTKYKRLLAQRLADAVLCHSYGKHRPCQYPIFDSADIEGKQIVVSFREVGAGLQAKGSIVKGFTVAGDDRKFVPAQARVLADRKRVSVYSQDCLKPVAVRYAWVDNPGCNLYGLNGLPVAPFRTDKW
jgi:sialate O-acetylesterase